MSNIRNDSADPSQMAPTGERGYAIHSEDTVDMGGKLYTLYSDDGRGNYNYRPLTAGRKEPAMKFTELEYSIIARALRVASDQYGRDADVALPTSTEMARNFTDQQITTRVIAERIEEEEGV